MRLEIGGIANGERKPVEAGFHGVAFLRAAAVPCIHRQMMVIAAGREERRVRARILRRSQADGLFVEGAGGGDFADPQVNVPDAHPRRCSLIVASFGVCQLHEVIDIELFGAHFHHAAAPDPGVLRPVAINLDAVAFGIVEIDRLADIVIGKT
ncbi:hypothetical protein D3C86_1462290 [compost metagenome]